MFTFVPPIRRGDFLYSSILYADAGNGHHHPRASVADLAGLLRPDPRSYQFTTPAKDQVGHWYTAQLLHYGLPSTKDKNAAKMRLLDAMNQCKLEVPAWILKVEAELKKDWEKENRKVKKGGKATAKDGNNNKTVSRIPYGGVNLTVNVSVSSSHSPAQRVATTTPAKIAKAPPKTPVGKRKREAPDTTKPKPSPNNAMTIAPDDGSWPMSTKTIIPNHGPHYYDPGMYTYADLGAPYGGVYRVSCPEVELDWPGDAINEFILAFSQGEEEWWSRIEWGNIRGILVLELHRTVSQAVPVSLRCRAHHSGINTDGAGTGRVVFTAMGVFKGEFHHFFGSEACHFQGKKVQTARRSTPGEAPQIFPRGAPILDRMREDWTRMPAISSYSYPTKESFFKQEKGYNSSPSQSTQFYLGYDDQIPPSKRPRVKQEHNYTSPPRSTPRIKQERTYPISSPTPSQTISPYIKQEPDHSYNIDDAYGITLSGTYNITCPRATNTFGSNDLRLTLCKDGAREIWWASFCWGAWDCIIQLNPGPSFHTLGKPCSFGWRLRDLETGELKFGKRCTGEVTLYSNQRMRGKLFEVPGVGTVEFWGPRIGAEELGWSGDEYAEEWEGFIKQAYGR